MKIITNLCLLIFSLMTYSITVLAHPHAFVEIKNKVLVENNQLIGFRMQWVLDEASSAEMLYDLALAGNDDNAKQAIADEIMQNVVAEHYFSYLYDKNQQAIKYKALPQNYGATAIDNQIMYYFDFLLAKPQLLQQNQFSLATYDASYYVFMYYNQEHVASVLDFSDLPINCKGALIEPNVDQQLQAYAQSLDKSQQDEDLTLGAQFAQKVVLICD